MRVSCSKLTGQLMEPAQRGPCLFGGEHALVSCDESRILQELYRLPYPCYFSRYTLDAPVFAPKNGILAFSLGDTVSLMGALDCAAAKHTYTDTRTRLGKQKRTETRNAQAHFFLVEVVIECFGFAPPAETSGIR